MTGPMPPWTMRPLAGERYSRLGAQTQGDPGAGWHLAGLVDAKAAMWDDLEQAAHDSPDGAAGWEATTDPATCRRAWLPWAAQLYGEQVPVETISPAVGDSVVDLARSRVLAQPHTARGTTRAVVAAALAHMTSTALIVRDRYDPLHSTADSPYHLTLIVRDTDVPDLAALTTAAEKVKPGWVLLHVVASDVRTWAEVVATWPTWDTVVAANPTWNSLLTP